MNSSSTFLENLKFNLTALSNAYGTGVFPLDLAFVLIACGVGLLTLLFLLVLFRPGAKKRLEQSIELSKGLHGKIEKLEKQLNDTRTDTLRKLEFLTRRIQALEKTPQPEETPILPKSTEEVTPSEEQDFFFENDSLASVPAVDLTENDLTENAFVPTPLEEQAPHSPLPFPKSEASLPKTLESGLVKTRRGFFQRLKEVFSLSPKLGADEIEELESLLVSSDLGVTMTMALISSLKEDLKRGDEITQESLIGRLQEKVLEIVGHEAPAPLLPKKIDGRPKIILMVGVNGVGKTTTTAKLARQWKAAGAKILLVAADTFRAAAVEQLKTWGQRLDIPVSFGAENAKPATVVFDALERSKREDFDVILIDTAGRLHTKANLMQEIEGVRNIIERQYGCGPDEVLLVLDGSTGQNALSQAQEFHQALTLTGLVITKLDGTAKGGIVVAIKQELGIPIRYIGVGEGELDLRDFEAKSYVQALFDDTAIEELAEPSLNAMRRRNRRAVGEA